MEGISPGVISRLEQGNQTSSFCLKVEELQHVGEARCLHASSDGVGRVKGDISGLDMINLVRNGDLKEGSTMRVLKSTVSRRDGANYLSITELEVLPDDAQPSQSSDRMEDVREAKQNPAMRIMSPTSNCQETSGSSSLLESFPGNCKLSPLQALNPYSQDWALKAKISQKFPKQSCMGKDGEKYSRFGLRVVDEHGTEADMTFWREAADKYSPILEENKVYIFSKVSVKPANKLYTSLSFDYALSMGFRSKVFNSTDQAISNVKGPPDVTSLADLHKFLGRKVSVSVMGIVLRWNNVSSVKRKTDNVERVRREITIMDRSLKSVVTTLWGNLAEQVVDLDTNSSPAPVVIVSMCLVSDYNGLSLNATSRSTVDINPDFEEATALRKWFESEGRHISAAPLGEEQSKRRSSALLSKRVTISDMQPASIPPIEAKPQYGVVCATITYINPDQNFVYLANTENHKKVIEQGSKYFCEADGQMYESAKYMYAANIKVMDSTGECWLTLFNDEMETILGITADHLSATRTSDSDAFRALVTSAQGHPHLFRVAWKSRTDLKKNEIRLRHTVVALHKFDWVSEAKNMLMAIKSQM